MNQIIKRQLMACCCLVTKSRPTLLQVALWTTARQASLSIGFSRQEYWNGLPFPSPGGLPHARTEPVFPSQQADSLPLNNQGGQWRLDLRICLEKRLLREE